MPEYSAMRDGFITTADCFLICLSLVDKSSLARMDEFYQRIAWRDATRPSLLVGTKCDLVHERQVSQHDIAMLQSKYDAKYVETSAKTNVNVTLAFSQIAHAAMQHDPRLHNVGNEKKCIIM